MNKQNIEIQDKIIRINQKVDFSDTKFFNVNLDNQIDIIDFFR